LLGINLLNSVSTGSRIGFALAGYKVSEVIFGITRDGTNYFLDPWLFSMIFRVGANYYQLFHDFSFRVSSIQTLQRGLLDLPLTLRIFYSGCAS